MTNSFKGHANEVVGALFSYTNDRAAVRRVEEKMAGPQKGSNQYW